MIHFKKVNILNKNLNKNLLILLSLLIVIVSIPITVYLVKQRQIFKSKASGKSKLSFQTSWQKPGAMEFIETAQPMVVKLLGGYDRAGEIKQKSPGTFIIGRIWEQDNQPFDGEPENRAQEWFDRHRGTLETGGIDCWEGYNEPPTNHTDEIPNMQWYSRHEIRRMQLLESIGKRACIGNFSVGNPDFPLWPYFRDAMNYASSNGHFLGLHEYGPGSMGDRSEYLSLRHRKVYADNGFDTPLFITETGIDSGGGPGGGGWRAHTDAGDYFNQLKWYDDRLQEDGYVRGATIFSYGLYDWESFELYPDLTGEDGRSGLLPQYIAGGDGGGGGGDPPACDSGQVNMSFSPNPGTVGQNMTFTVSGSQGSTWIGDSWSGGVDCSGEFWGSKTCSATANGSFTWTHTWENCAPNDCSKTSGQCSKQIQFNVGGGDGTPPPSASNTKIYVNPNPVGFSTPTTVTATGTISCSTDISYNFGAGLTNCEQSGGFSCSGNPKGDGNPCWWRWSCTSGTAAGIYTATFNAAGTNCASSRQYTLKKEGIPTPTPSLSPSPTPTESSTPTPTPISVTITGVTFNGTALDLTGNSWSYVTLGSGTDNIYDALVDVTDTNTARHLLIKFIYQPTASPTPTSTPTPISTSTPTASPTPSPTAIQQYDLNGDMIVNSIDIGLFFDEWRRRIGGEYSTTGDFNYDGVINSIDYSMLRGQVSY